MCDMRYTGNMSKHDFADLIREIRKRSGLTQQEFADRVGCGRPLQGQIERGIKPSPDYTWAIIERFGLNELEAASLWRAGARAQGWQV